MLTASLPTEMVVADELALAIDVDRLHFFAAGTGKRIGKAYAPRPAQPVLQASPV